MEPNSRFATQWNLRKIYLLKSKEINRNHLLMCLHHFLWFLMRCFFKSHALESEGALKNVTILPSMYSISCNSIGHDIDMSCHDMYFGRT